MKIQYLSHYDKTLQLEPMDCVIAQSGSMLNFYLVESVCAGDVFQLYSKCLECTQTESMPQNSRCLFSFTSLNSPRGNSIMLSQMKDLFHRECVCGLLENVSDILKRESDLWDFTVLQDLLASEPVICKELILAKGEITECKTQDNSKTKAAGMPNEYKFSAKPNIEYGTVISADQSDEIDFTWGPYSISKCDGKILLVHPSFGRMNFDAISIYGNTHVIGWNMDQNAYLGQNLDIGRKDEFVLLTTSNRSRTFSSISSNCYEGYHIAVSKNGQVSLIKASSAQEITASIRNWEDILEVNSGMVITAKSGKLHAVELDAFNFAPREKLTNLDDITWQKDCIFLVRNGKDIRIFNSRSKMISKQYRQVRWISPMLVCCHDGGTLYSIIDPYRDMRKALYIGTNPREYIEETTAI